MYDYTSNDHNAPVKNQLRQHLRERNCNRWSSDHVFPVVFAYKLVAMIFAFEAILFSVSCIPRNKDGIVGVLNSM